MSKSEGGRNNTNGWELTLIGRGWDCWYWVIRQPHCLSFQRDTANSPEVKRNLDEARRRDTRRIKTHGLHYKITSKFCSVKFPWNLRKYNLILSTKAFTTCQGQTQTEYLPCQSLHGKNKLVQPAPDWVASFCTQVVWRIPLSIHRVVLGHIHHLICALPNLSWIMDLLGIIGRSPLYKYNSEKRLPVTNLRNKVMSVVFSYMYIMANHVGYASIWDSLPV